MIEIESGYTTNKVQWDYLHTIRKSDKQINLKRCNVQA